MLAIRLQRQGRKGYATYRFIVQDARRSPASGRVVARIGSYNPHTKEVNLDKEKAKFYLDNGAQPSDTIAKLLKGQKIKMPAWVETPAKQKRAVRNPEKLRKNQAQAPEPAKDKAEVSTAESKPVEQTADTDAKAAEETAAEDKQTNEEAQEEQPAKTAETQTKEEPEENKPEDNQQEEDEPKAKTES